MIIGALATTADCREGNCPTVYLTDRGNVVVQGYVTSWGGVEVPELILRGAATQIVARGIVATPAIPSQRRRGEAPDVWRAPSGNLAVRGDKGTPDVEGLHMPTGESAVEVEAHVIVHELDRLSVLEVGA